MAWLAADVVRDAYPNVDPDPSLAGAPVRREINGDFAIELAGTPTLRIATNGRLLPPHPDGASGTALGNSTFVASDRATCAGRGGGVRLQIGVTRSGGGRPTALMPPTASIRVAAVGGAYESQVVTHIIKALAQLPPPAGDRADDPPLCCAAHRWLRSSTLDSVSRRHAARGDLARARVQLSRAAECSPDSVPIRVRLAELDERLERESDARRRWLEIGAMPTAGWTGRVAGARAKLARQQAATGIAPDAIASSIDVEWRWMESLTPTTAPRGPRPDAIDRLVRETWARRDARFALRVLSRHWPTFVADHPDRATCLLADLAAATGWEPAARILRAEGRAELARTVAPSPETDSPSALDTVARPITETWPRGGSPAAYGASPALQVEPPDYSFGPGLAAPKR